jgi:hypothetical protein
MASMIFWLHTSAMVKSDDAETKIANIPPFGLRMQSGLKTRLEEAAKANGRSLNSEIVARLERSFREVGRVASPVPAQYQEKLDEIEQLALSALFHPRWDAIEKRLAALEERLDAKST